MVCDAFLEKLLDGIGSVVVVSSNAWLRYHSALAVDESMYNDLPPY